jgi:hypothetical protein
MQLCHCYEPFIKQMIRKINTYVGQARHDIDLLSKLLTFYRHLIDSKKENEYWLHTENL